MGTLNDIVDLQYRKDIRGAEKLRIFWAFVLTKFQGGTNVRFLGHRIFSHSRVNTIGILKEVFLKGDYAFKTNNKSPVIFDAGANIGAATLFFKRYFPHANILSFEAASTNFNFLKQNIERNNLQNVTPIFGALGKQEGTLTFYYNEQKPGSSTKNESVVESKTTSTFKKEEVPAIKLSNYVRGAVDLLKLDIEGGETRGFGGIVRVGKAC